MSDDIPSPWLPVMRDRGLDSYRKLGARAGISHEAARRVVRGWASSRRSIDAVADALGISPDRVHVLRGDAVPDRSREWVPPEASSALTHEEREVIGRLIRLMTMGREEVVGNAQHPAPMTTAPEAPAPAPEAGPPRPDGGPGGPGGPPGIESTPAPHIARVVPPPRKQRTKGRQHRTDTGPGTS